MKKIELEIVNLFPYQLYFHLILKEKYGTRRLPILIGGFEGRVISWTIEGIQMDRPLTHDLMVSILDAFDIVVKEAVITKIENSIFYAELVLEKGGAIIKVDSRASDAIAIALKTNAPIYAYEEVMKQAAIEITVIEKEHKKEKSLEDIPLNELEEMLQKAIEEENYEYASLIRDEIRRRKNMNS